MRGLSLLLLMLPLCAQRYPIPVGGDAYRQWDRWAYQRIGERAYMRSTYDRQGGNENADAAHFLYQLADDNNISLDVQGAGVVYFCRFNHWHGSPWRFQVDGRESIVQESSTADPLHPVAGSVYLPESTFPNPLAVTWSETRGADLSWVPLEFQNHFRIGYSRTFYGTGYYIYHQFVPGIELSHKLESWSTSTAPAASALDLLRRAGTDIAPAAGMNSVREDRGSVKLIAGAAKAVWTHSGPATVRLLQIILPRKSALAASNARLRITWDRRSEASVDAPLALFFGAGLLYNRDNREFLVKSLPMTVRYSGDDVVLSCYFPMPFFRHARMEIVGSPLTIERVRWVIRYEPFRDHPEDAGYFHATYADHPAPILGKDLVLLDTTRTEGGGDWSGSFIGTSFIFSEVANLRTLEGDPRFFFDDSQTPQAQGTGTEEWAGGGDYWGGLNMTLPLAGHPIGARSAETAVAPEDKVEAAYRFLLADLMPFGRNARIQLEHGGTNESTDHYQTVTYWYGLPAPSLIRTDLLHVGDEESEREHAYTSTGASPPYALTSRFELGPDTLHGVEIYPPETDTGRVVKNSSEFTLKIDPRNRGVMLRRKLDYLYPNQRAEVFIEKDHGGGWQPAGVWYLAGSNTCVYSHPKDELGVTEHVVQTSNRRFREDEFLLPLELTRGKAEIRVRIRFTPVEIPLFPGHPLPELGWSEMRYTAYSYVTPSLTWRNVISRGRQ